MNDDQLHRAAMFLYGAVKEAEGTRETVLVLPLRTAKRLADAIVAALNRPAGPTHG